MTTSEIGSRKKPKRGMTLVEVLVGIAILSVGTLILMQALGRVSWTVLAGESRLHALLFSFSKMGETELEIQAAHELPEKEEGIFRVNDREFRFKRTTQIPPDRPELRHVGLEVTWEMGRGLMEHHVETLLEQPTKESSET